MISQVRGFRQTRSILLFCLRLLGLLLICNNRRQKGAYSFVCRRAALRAGVYNQAARYFFRAVWRFIFDLFRFASTGRFGGKMLLPVTVCFSDRSYRAVFLLCLIFWHSGAFDKFWFWTFTYAREYTTRRYADQCGWEISEWR